MHNYTGQYMIKNVASLCFADMFQKQLNYSMKQVSTKKVQITNYKQVNFKTHTCWAQFVSFAADD